MNSEAIVDATPPPPPTTVTVAAPAKVCANCGAPLHGPFCYDCGQPEKGMIRYLGSVLADMSDTIFNVDSRIFRSIVPLYLRPGFLTTEYFAGRRTRYVTPFRLFFFLCIISFFAVQASLDIDQMKFDLSGDGDLDSAQTETEVREREKTALDEIAKARSNSKLPNAAVIGVDIAAAKIRTEAARRLAWIAAKKQAAAKGEKPPPDPNETQIVLFGDKPWDPVAQPINVGWLPDFADTALNAAAARAQVNLVAASKDPRHLIGSVFSVLPQTLFVMMPLFAVLLKIVYIFKRRLYMEHLMVALHSHAFVFMSLLLVAITTLLLGWAETNAVWSQTLLRFLRIAIWTWLPVYLFLMQKRIYRHGWIMAGVMYGMVGFCYVFILSFALVGAILMSLTL